MKGGGTGCEEAPRPRPTFLAAMSMTALAAQPSFATSSFLPGAQQQLRSGAKSACSNTAGASTTPGPYAAKFTNSAVLNNNNNKRPLFAPPEIFTDREQAHSKVNWALFFSQLRCV